jgi:preprotein translocase subunit SecG
MANLIPIAQIVVAVLLMLLILLQQRGAGLGSAFGQSGGFYATQRGLQKKIYWATIVLAVAFVALAVANLIIK